MPTATSNGTLVVVEKECKFAADRSQAAITLESTVENFPQAIEDLGSKAARDLALAYAATQGVPDPRINNMASPYPINAEGLPLELVRDEAGQSLPQNHARMQPAAYRIDIPVCRKLV